MSTAVLTRRNAFRLVGLTGWAAAAVLVATLAAQARLASGLVLLLAPLGLGCLLATVYLRQLITGRDRLVLIEDASVAGVVLIGVCALLGQPIRAWADLIAIGLAVFGGIGRIGCLIAGCCHGRPARVGLTYRQPAPAGPPLGIPLIPVPAIESAGLLGLAGAAITALGSSPPGSALGGVLLGYGLLRQATEFARGDRLPGPPNGTRRIWTTARTEAGVLILVAFAWL